MNQIKKLVLLNAVFIGLLLNQKIYSQSTNTIKILTANVRVALKEDASKGVGWGDRKEIVFEVIKNQRPDIICLQEILEIQNADFKKEFVEFGAIGFEGPEMDPYTDGGYYKIAKNPILYNKNKFQLIAAGQYWLSDSPHIAGSMAWGTSRARHVNWIRLEENVTGKQFRVINTHLDHISNVAKQKQVEMIVEEANQYQEKFIQILVGDFNSNQISDPINYIKKSWQDSYAIMNNNLDPGNTVHHFKGETTKSNSGKVDFIFYKGSIVPVDSVIVKDQVEGKYPSDHYFVTAQFRFI